MSDFFQKVLNGIDTIVDKSSLDAFISKLSTEYELQLDPSFQRENGCYYTHMTLARDIVRKVITENGLAPITLPRMRFFEPCVGIGNFVFAYLDFIASLNLSETENLMTLSNVYVADNDNDALQVFKMLFTCYAKVVFNVALPFDFFVGRIGHGLLFDLSIESPKYISLESAFPAVDGKFDIIITNPPYKNLKAENKEATDSGRHSLNKDIYAQIKDLSQTTSPLSSYGVLNIYKLFVEEIITKYANNRAAIGLLIPSSFLTDKTCSNLRKHVLSSHSLKLVDVLPENNPYLNAQQAVCSVVLRNNEQGGTVKICNDYKAAESEYIIVENSTLLNDATDNAIFALSENEYKIFAQLLSFPKVKELPFIQNLRGELDLTANKGCIQSAPSEFRLVRGRDIGWYSFHAEALVDYVNPSFVQSSPKAKYICSPRIVCQQISNIQKDRRVAFTQVPTNTVLGNSCNFMAVAENQHEITLEFLLGLLNSNIINWYFKLLSTNNHVNNYEIDSFPIPLNSPYKKQIATLAKECNMNNDEIKLSEINRLVNMSFGIDAAETAKEETQNGLFGVFLADIRKFVADISSDDAQCLLDSTGIVEFVLAKYKTGNRDRFTYKCISSLLEKYRKLLKEEVLNHTTFKLSDLDMEMVRSVPQGGSWKDIPQSTVSKSKRLIRINETGGRTTLYGRIDYSKPSYTITTYFNRPGNGSYIHPIHDRVISVREAARLQSFPDDFYFTGNKTELLKQVGNAVPPLLAYSIGQNIKSKLSLTRSIDLFSGAGGLSLGMKFAGIDATLAIDFDEAACMTYKTNMPETEVLCADITLEETKRRIIDNAKKNNVEVLFGGPPCQGFSLAGKRFIDDPRNQLFKHYIDIAAEIKPKVIMFENVEGLLTFQNGEIYREILNVFSSLGYNAEGRTLMANEYGVPQKRKRVIILCTRNDLSVTPADLFPVSDNVISFTAYDAIADLEEVACAEIACYRDTKKSKYIRILDALSNSSKQMLLLSN
ncbi:hypothetical protein FACS1894211_06610 [Clostridia bacterium]|nr:hypothetical protein FACS1894211_06610 [Clostridia bacterium]